MTSRGRPAVVGDGLRPNPWAIFKDKVRDAFGRTFKKWAWLIPLVLAILAFAVVLLTVPVSGKSAPDKMVAAFVALLGVSGALTAAVFAWRRRAVAVAKVGLVAFYLVMAVVPAVIGVIDVLPDGAYRHRLGAGPVLLALSAAGTLGLFASLLLGWLSPQNGPTS